MHIFEANTPISLGAVMSLRTICMSVLLQFLIEKIAQLSHLVFVEDIGVIFVVHFIRAKDVKEGDEKPSKEIWLPPQRSFNVDFKR